MVAVFATVAASGVGVAIWWSLRRRRGRRQRQGAAPTGVGAALAHALEGDLDTARAMLERLVRHGGAQRADAIVALVAVLRAQGDAPRAEALVERLGRVSSASWIEALRVRVALDGGHLERAARLVERGAAVPVDLAVAALCRSGQWGHAARVYRERTPKRERDLEIEGALLAGEAAAAARAGDLRAAQKTLKRALGVAPDAFLVVAVASVLHPKPTERARFARALESYLRPGDGESPAGAPGISSADEVEGLLSAARARFEAGEREVALGILRDHLDKAPRAWLVRRQYAQWMLAHGGPADWRTELAEVLTFLPGERVRPTVRFECRACGYEGREEFFVCPRCDAIGRLAARPEHPGSARSAVPSEAGARLDDLLRGVKAETPGSAS